MLAILSDIHSNLAALEAVVADARKLGCVRFISLGDVAGYGAQLGECIDVLGSLHAINILGNHDSYITQNKNCPRSRVVSQIIEYQRRMLNGKQLEWMKDSVNRLQDDGILFIHGGPENPLDQYLYKITKDIIPCGVRWLFSGHTHVQTLVDYGMSGYCNPGSVGQPRDGDNRAAYAVMDGDAIALRRIPYDIDRTANAMKAAGFEQFCYENLYAGAQIGGRIDHVEITFP